MLLNKEIKYRRNNFHRAVKTEAEFTSRLQEGLH